MFNFLPDSMTKETTSILQIHVYKLWYNF